MTANYKFGRFELRPTTRQLLADDRPAPLGERAFDVLVALIERRERVVAKEELLDLAWPGLVVEENNLQVQVSTLRKILGTDAIATVAGKGYRFALQVDAERLSHPIPPLETRPVADVADKPSIAVLPFVNTSDDTANEYFADGLAEELLNVLSKIRGLRVASRTSAFSFKGAKVDIPTMAQKLNVATILEGSVRKAGNRVRISAQLIHVATDSHLWSATYDRQLEDIFAVQDDIAQSVVNELRAALMGEKPDVAASAAVRSEIEAAARGRGENAEAYRLYLQASFHNDRLTAEDFAIAIEAYRAALNLDPSYALAWAGLSIAYADGTAQGWLGTDLDEGFRLAREAAGKAMQLAPDLAESHEALGVIRFANEWDWKGAEASFARALELAPHNIRIRRHTVFMLLARGRYEETIALLRRAAELDPLSGAVHCYLATSYRIAGRLDEAEAAIRKSLELSPHSGFAHHCHSDICLAQGRLDEALEAAKREIHDTFRLLALADVYHAQGRHTESNATLKELVETRGHEAAFQIAEVFAYRGDRDQAFAWLERACAQRDAGMSMLRASPSMRGLHGDAALAAVRGESGACRLMAVCVLLFTDVVDSTRLVERLGDARAAELWSSHDRRARQLLAQHRGREIDRADGFFLLFNQMGNASRFALAYHEALADLALSARVGIHAGPITLRENAPDEVARGAKHIEVEGLAKPLAARIMALARGGQTLMSAAARIALGDEALHEGAEIARHGHYRLKGIEEPVEIFELGVRDSSPFSPPTDVDKAHRVIRAGDFWRPVREVRHNLPAERDAFVGRIAELRALAARLDTGVRLVTVLGPGGTGKTRFVRRFGRTWLGDWPGGVYFCDLSEARTRDGILFAVASTLEVPLGKDDPIVRLGHAIAGRGRSLVILDNFEQVAQHAPATLGLWLDQAPEAAFVVTSRERLHLPGEEVFPIEPLPLEMDAIELFATRARAQKPDFTLDESNRAAVAEIVRLLDGLPLAIELAAARVLVLSPAQTVERMRDRFNLLASARGPAARQATLRAAIDWSWDLLTPWEQAAFAQCSIFDGGFSLDAAEAVLDLSAWADAPPVIDAIQALVDKSLLRVWRPKGSGWDIAEPFFGMYLSIHEYASQKMHGFGERPAADAEQRHGHYFAGFGSEDALDALLRHGGVVRRKRLGEELDNLISACRRATRRPHPDIAAACFLAAWAVFEAQGPFGMAATLGREVAGLDGLAPRLDAQVRIAMSSALRAGGEIEQSDAALAEALAIARQAQDRRSEAMALRHIAIARHRQGRMDEASQTFDMARALSETLTDRGNLAVLLANMANLQMELGRMAEARATYEAALAMHREVGNRAGEGIALGNLGTLHHELGHAADARAAYDAALLIHRETGRLQQEAITLSNLGVLDNQEGNQQEAAAHYRASLKIHRETGDRRGEGVVLSQIGDLHHTLGEFALAQENYDAALHIHREVGNRRFEGGVMGSLGALLIKQGRIEAGLQVLESGEHLLRQVDDPLDLAKLLCVKGSTALAGGNAEAARSALAEAESISARLGVGLASDLGQQIETLRRSLEEHGLRPR